VPPSRSSTASRLPVEAPDGTTARPKAPTPSRTSTSIVGLPRLSKTCRARTSLIVLLLSALTDLTSTSWDEGGVEAISGWAAV
jgi:hypothetical protein